MKRLACLALPLALLGACTNGCNPPPNDTKAIRDGGPNIAWCPGSPGCLATGEADIQAGVGWRSIVPPKFEIANLNYFQKDSCDPWLLTRFGSRRCGYLRERLEDCGTDGLCPGDMGYAGPDADHTESDNKADWFKDCGLDRICPDNVPEGDDPVTADVNEASDGVDNDGDGAVDDGPYTGPDDGENDGIFTAAWLAGFGTNRPAMGFYDAPEVGCTAYRTNETTVVLCTVDVVGYFNSEVTRTRAKFKQAFPDLDLDYLAISSTHTHENVDTMGQWGRADPIPITPGNLKYERNGVVEFSFNAFINDQLVAAAADAIRSLKPAKLSITTAHTGAAGFVDDLMDPQIIDDSLTVVEARARQDNAPIFTAVHWGNHPEIMDDDNNLMTSDYVGVVRRAVEKGLPATGDKPALEGRGGKAVYMQGTVGGLMSQIHVDFTGRNGVFYDSDITSYGRMEAYGQNLAERVLTAMQDTANVTQVERGEIKVKAQSFFIPVINRLFIFGFAAGLFDRDVYDETNGERIDTTIDSLLDRQGSALTESWTMDLGPVSWAGVPGELLPEVAMGGTDGSKSFGKPVVALDYCQPQSECAAKSGNPADCPVTEPAEGWQDCDCEACRLCAPPDLASAPTTPTIKDRMPGLHKMVVGLSNDELGYFVPPWLFKVSKQAPYFCQAKHHYPETNSTGPFAVPRTLETLNKLFDWSL